MGGVDASLGATSQIGSRPHARPTDMRLCSQPFGTRSHAPPNRLGATRSKHDATIQEKQPLTEPSADPAPPEISASRPTRAWLWLLRKALSAPGARVDRDAFLRGALSKRVPPELVEAAIAHGPARAGVATAVIKAAARSSILHHKVGVTAASAVASIPGGFAMAATLPLDQAQFFGHVTTVVQKLAYLHGWGELLADGEDIDDETVLAINLFIGAMLGATEATKALAALGEALGRQAAKRIPRMPLTRFGLYRVAVKIARWLGVSLTKKVVADAAAKAIPFVGAGISGALTWITFQKMSARLEAHLETLYPHTGHLSPTEAAK